MLDCKICPAGSYAPKILDMGHFEEMPASLMTSCTLATRVGDQKDCLVNKGWHVNNYQMIDSNGVGIPQGLKFSIKSVLGFTNLNGGTARVWFKMKDFHSNEYFRILINGIL